MKPLVQLPSLPKTKQARVLTLNWHRKKCNYFLSTAKQLNYSFDLCSRKSLTKQKVKAQKKPALGMLFFIPYQLCLRSFSPLPASLLFTTLCFSQSHRRAWSKLFTESMDSLAISSKCWAQALHPKKCWMYLLMTCSTIWGLSSRPTRQGTGKAPAAGKWSGGSLK